MRTVTRKGNTVTHVRVSSRWTIEVIRTVLILAIVLAVGAVYTARGDNHDTTFYACLYAGSFSQINTNGPPTNCGRGQQVQWNSQGIQGLPGVDGVSGYELISSGPLTVEPLFTALGTATCPEGKVVLGGGAYAGLSLDLVMVESAPEDSSTWSVLMRNTSESEQAFYIFATCASMSPDSAP